MRFSEKKTLAFIGFLIFSIYICATEKDRLAVMDAQDKDKIFTQSTRNKITNYIFVKLQGSGKYWMIPKTDRDAALQKAIDDTMKSSRRECVDEKCQLSMTAQLQANFLINTEIVRLFKGQCQINIRKFDVEKRAGTEAWEQKFDCSEKGLFEAVDEFSLDGKVYKRQHNNNQKLIKSKETNASQKFKIWSEKAPKAMLWQDAKIYCDNLREDGYSNWRMPSISELRTTVRNCPNTENMNICKISDDCLHPNCLTSCSCSFDSSGRYSVFSDIDRFWSYSELPNNKHRVWTINFNNAGITDVYKMEKNRVRCVRPN